METRINLAYFKSATYIEYLDYFQLFIIEYHRSITINEQVQERIDGKL